MLGGGYDIGEVCPMVYGRSLSSVHTLDVCQSSNHVF